MLYSFYCLFLGIALLPLKKVLFLPVIEYKILLADFFSFYQVALSFLKQRQGNGFYN